MPGVHLRLLCRGRRQLGVATLAVEKVLTKGMARNSEDRYATTLEFADALKAAVGGGGNGGGVIGRMLGR